MTMHLDIIEEYGIRLKAVLKVAGLAILTMALVPAQLLFQMTNPTHPFMVSQIFYGLVGKVLGFRLRTHGAMATDEPVLFVANHTSYLDIVVLGALIPASFVAKADVEKWPLIGILSKMQKTIFIERKSSKVSGQKTFLQSHLAEKRSLILFPEGTSSDGQRVLPFKSALFSIAEEAIQDIKVTVQPISLVCTSLDGMPLTRGLRSFYSWYGDMTLVPHLWKLFCLGDFTIDIIFHPPIRASDFPDRKTLAQYCQQQVAQGVEQGLTGRQFLPAPVSYALPSPSHDRT